VEGDAANLFLFADDAKNFQHFNNTVDVSTFTEWTDKWLVKLNVLKRLKVKAVYIALHMGNPSQSYGTSLAIWDHTVLPVSCHPAQVNTPRLNPSQ